MNQIQNNINNNNLNGNIMLTKIRHPSEVVTPGFNSNERGEPQ